MKEEWRDIVGYEGSYQVSNLGRVRSLDREIIDTLGRRQKIKGRILKQHLQGSKKTYLSISLHLEGKIKNRTTHSIVAEAFFGARPEGFEVCHGEKGPECNSVSNLSYGTKSDNFLDKHRDGTMVCRPVRRSDGKEYRSAFEACHATGVDNSSIGKVCKGKKKTAGGYSWEFI